MVIARKIAYNVLVSSVSKILSTALALASIGFITRYLGKEGFGDYATILAFLSFFSAISDLGLYQFSTREISRSGANAEEIMGNAFSMRILSSLVIFLFSFVLILFLPYSQEVKWGVVIIAASFVFSSGYQILNGVFQKNLAMDRVAISELLGKIVQLGVIILAVKLKLGFSWIITSLLFNMLISFSLVYFWSKKYIKIGFRFDFAYWKRFLLESYPIGVMAIVVFVYFKVDTIILSIIKSSAEVGVYNVAYKVLENISFFPAMIVGLIFPIISQYILSDKARFSDISNKTFKVFVLLVIPLIVGTLFLSDGLVYLIAGKGFSESALVLRILVFALASIFFSNFFNAILIAGNLQKKLMLILSVAAVFNVTANLIFIPIFSYVAAATISFMTEFFVTIAAGYLVFKRLNYFPRVEKVAKILFSGVMMAGFLFIFRTANFYLAGFGSVCVYSLFLWIFQAVETSEITSIISKKGTNEYENPISQS
jgi:O-antigen/teichoic acid export membrane protein